jgi:hypothetical protein
MDRHQIWDVVRQHEPGTQGTIEAAWSVAGSAATGSPSSMSSDLPLPRSYGVDARPRLVKAD